MDRPARDGTSPPATAEAGRTASAWQLRRHLSTAPAAFVEGALDNPELDEEAMVLLLRNREATPEVLRHIGRDRRWTVLYEIKKGLLRHPRTPLAVSRSLVHHLRWRDLAETAAEAHAHPWVRRKSEDLLKVRLTELALGERVTLARVASRGVIQVLRQAAEEPVLVALLGNSRLVELDAVTLASSGRAPSGVLRRLARHPVWGARHAVRMALVANPRTPVPVALGVVRRLSRQDLRRLAKDVRVPKIVRIGADRRLEGRDVTARRRPAGGP